ncbi:MAG TPA: hypothetical protein VH008_05965 [Pseudonocardia sp.]|jgi:hypothetical protein|nr:hypothetical protein [Pseudonocardia sp.]
MLALIGALLFLIALIVELFVYPAPLDAILTTAGLLLVALYLGGVGPRTFSKFW